MRKLNPFLILWSLLAIFFFASCEEEEEAINLTPETVVPTITFLSPEMPTNNEFTPTVGETLTFSVRVEDETGLSQVFVNGNLYKTYMGEVTVDTIHYDLTIGNTDLKELLFSVEDGWRNTANTSKVTVYPVAVPNPPYIILDFAGASTSNETVMAEERILYNFDVTGTHTNSATAEVAANQAKLSFAMPNPDGTGKVLKIVKQPVNPDDNWGGWVNTIFNLMSPLPEEIVQELPQYDAENTGLTPGTKVIKLDVYYDATVDPNFGWDDVLAATGVWNANPTLGYKVDLTLADYEAHAPGGHDNAGYFISYSAYIPEPNKWVTLTFDAADEGRAGNFGQITAAEVDAVNIKPAPGYSANDNNPIFIKNLKIVEVEE